MKFSSHEEADFKKTLVLCLLKQLIVILTLIVLKYNVMQKLLNEKR